MFYRTVQSTGVSFQTNPCGVEASKCPVDSRRISRLYAADEIERGRELLDVDVRAVGIVASAGLERHQITTCQESDEVVEFSLNDTITGLSQSLYEGSVIGQAEYKHHQYLAEMHLQYLAEITE